MEAELSKLRSQNRNPEPQIDLAKLKEQLIQDPTGFLANVMKLSEHERLHVNRVNFAHMLGDQAPQEMRYLAQLGPQVAQQSALAAAVNDLSRLVDEQVVKPKKAESTRESIKALLADKAKYPHLATAIANNPTLLDSKVIGRTGSAEEIVQALESEAAAYATAFGVKPAPAQPASDNADSNKAAQSTESKSAPLAGTPVGDPPPLPPPSPGPITPDEDKRIREELSRKYGLAK